LDVTLRALLHKDVRFVQEQHCIPHLADFEDGFEFGFEFLGFGAEFAHVDHLQWFVQGFGRCLGGQRLADPRGTVQQEDQAVTLALDHVCVNSALVVDQELQSLFLCFRHHNPVDAVRVEADGLQ